jgi:hypothetical protein
MGEIVRVVKKKPRVSVKVMDGINQLIAEGEGLKRICQADPTLPSYRTVLRHIREDDEAYQKYREARTIQAEVMRDEVVHLAEAPLPIDPKLAMAEVNRRRLEVDVKLKHIAQMQPSQGVRSKGTEDPKSSLPTGELVLKWGGGEDVGLADSK